ncbi:MAG TPA: methylmalonyl-CoA mutase family protein, partial [Aestuariivirgaceae bacterium]|nr:methylmalonyl-CoA mutase family protein [Aestuariivirgaceae bacterium]
GKLDDGKLARAVGVTLAAEADVFLTLAKFRAMRILWRQVLSASGLDPVPLRLHAETSWRMMTRYDVHTNLLRGLAACFAAGLGGADSIAVLPHTAVHGLADGFARRMARNAQTILQAECGLHRVDDPVAGSAYADALTAELASRAWSFFQSIEAQGGIVAALQTGFVRTAIAATATERRRRIARRDQPILGTTVFAEPDDLAPDVSVQVAPAKSPWGARDAEVFESLRLAAGRLTEKPRVFIANLGPPAEHAAAAANLRSLLVLAGLPAVEGAGYATAADAVAAFKTSGATVAAVCASDATRWKAIAVAALEAAGARWVIDGPPHDALAFVKRLHAELGIGS